MDWIIFGLGAVAGIAGLAALVGLGMLIGALLQHRAEEQFWNNEEE